MACIMVIVGCISLSHAMMEKEKTWSRKGGRKIFISFMALSDWKIVFRLNYCLPFMEPKGGKNLKKYFPKSALFCLSSCMLSHFIFFLPTYTSLQVISHSTFFHFRISRARQLFLTFCALLNYISVPSFFLCHVTQSEIINWHLLLACSHSLDSRKKLPAARKLWGGWRRALWFNGVTVSEPKNSIKSQWIFH